jgi:hypothetical protein
MPLQLMLAAHNCAAAAAAGRQADTAECDHLLVCFMVQRTAGAKSDAGVSVITAARNSTSRDTTLLSM